MLIKKITKDLSLYDEENILVEFANKIGLDIIFFDIETTGFHRQYSKITTIGALLYNGSSKAQLTQYFSDKPSTEKEVLESFLDYLNTTGALKIFTPKLLFTYNGKRFDIPYLNAKFEQYGLQSPFHQMPHIDLYDVAKSCFPSEKNLSLKKLETMLNISRNDKISGFDAVTKYKEYLETGNEKAADLILLHNEDDIGNMVYLLRLFYYDHQYLLPKKMAFEGGIIYDIEIKDFALMYKLYLSDMTKLVSICKSYDEKSVKYFNIHQSPVISVEIQLISRPIPSTHGKVGRITFLDCEAFWGKSFEELDEAKQSLSIVKSTNPQIILMENVYRIIDLSIS